MSASAGDGRVAIVLLALAMGGCVGAPDALITVTRADTDRVTVQLCPLVGDASQCRMYQDVFVVGDPATASRTVGIYLGQPADSLRVLFTEFAAPNFCYQLTLPFSDDNRAPTVALPADSGTDATFTDCVGCNIAPGCTL